VNGTQNSIANDSAVQQQYKEEIGNVTEWILKKNKI
jgi:hypothetical protein